MLQTQKQMMDGMHCPFSRLSFLKCPPIATEQDTHLEHLSHSINRQHHISLQINDELDVHTGLLEELDTDLDTTHSRLSGARRRLDRVAKGAKENGAYSLALVQYLVTD
jgi:syntaxin 8